MVLLWWLEGSPQLGEAARTAIADPRNEVFVSAASAWEIAIKLGRGRLPAPPDVGVWLPRELAAHRFRPLPITVQHAAAVEQLPLHHRDPFDRILVAQAIAEDLRLVTADEAFARYQIPVVPCG